MAYPIELTISTGNKVTVKYQSQEVTVSLTYRLEREDIDVLALAHDKSKELISVHQAVWENVRTSSQTNPSRQKPSEQNESGVIVPTMAPEPIGEIVSTESERLPDADAANHKVASIPGQHLALRALLLQSGMDEAGIEQLLVTRFERDALEDLSFAQASQWLLELQRTERERVRSHRTSTDHKSADRTYGS